jgi:hypothetical protein
MRHHFWSNDIMVNLQTICRVLQKLGYKKPISQII